MIDERDALAAKRERAVRRALVLRATVKQLSMIRREAHKAFLAAWNVQALSESKRVRAVKAALRYRERLDLERRALAKASELWNVVASSPMDARARADDVIANAHRVEAERDRWMARACEAEARMGTIPLPRSTGTAIVSLAA